MDEDKRARVDSLLEEALAISVVEREAFLSRISSEDLEVGREVSSLLRCHERAGTFLEAPLAGACLAEGESPVFAAGETVAGRFQIVEMRDRGGMGQVYEALDLELKERVALKTIRPELACDEKVVDRFRREVHLARKVTHRNVCRIHDVFLEGREGSVDILFLTMELLPGENLARYLERKERLDWREAVPILTQILSGLEAAFAAGVVHRDLKAENVMLVPEGQGVRAVVADFGLSAAAESDREPGLPPEGHSRPWGASSRSSMGTPAYMSPEQLRGEAGSHRGDIFSFGVIAYEMLTGENPYPFPNEADPPGKRFETKPRSVWTFQRSVPRELNRLVLQSLALKPSLRPNASELRRRMDAIPLTIPPRRMALLAAASTAGGALVLVKGSPLVWDLIERWVFGPRVLPLEEFVDSPKALASLQEGLVKVRDGANLSATPFLENAVREDPNSALAQAFLIDVLLNVGRLDVVKDMTGHLRETVASSSRGLATDFSRAVLARAVGDYTVALELLETIGASYADDLNLLLSRARVLEEAGDIPLARQLYEGVRSESRAAVLGLCRCLTIVGEIERAIDVISNLLHTGELGDDPEVLGMAHTILGVARRDEGHPEIAVESFEQALYYREKAHDRRGQVASMSHLGSVYRLTGRVEDAILILQKALVIGQPMGDRAYESQVLHTLAISYDLVGRTEEAVTAWRESLQIELARQDHAEIPQRLSFLATFHRRRGQYGEAHILLDRGQEHTSRSGDREVEAHRLLTLSIVQAEEGRYAEAEETLLRVLSIIEGVREPSAAEARIRLARLYDERGDYLGAERFGHAAFTKLERFPSSAEFALGLLWKSEHLAQLGDFGASREAIKKARDRAQSLHLRETLRELAILEAELDLLTVSASDAAAELESACLHAKVNEFAWLFVRASLALGRAYRRLGRIPESVHILREAAAAASKAGMASLSAAAEILLSEIVLSEGDPVEARERAKRGLSAAESCRARPLLRQAAALLGETSARLGRDQEAVKFFEQSRQLHRDIVSHVPRSHAATYLKHPDVRRVIAKLDGAPTLALALEC
jgi:tetratricopeptide (TPR) repeat protein/tRNA A-37 threonylcarbamoyl transferase component Bud32